MILTEKQRDSLTELINIAFHRTTASLSELTGNRILLDPPKIDIVPIEEISEKLGEKLNKEIATVHQIFTGPVSGDALLLMDYNGAIKLASLVSGEDIELDYFSLSLREVLMEMGNILLNACLGVFGNLLEMHISFSVPKLHLEELDSLLDTLTIVNEELKYALIAFTKFRVKDSAIDGYLVIILGVASLEKLIEALERLG
ncbi:MAG: chemotaxis protein CheC [bacterium]|nr:chemotaxis protein CheC [bacterium]